MSIFVEEGDLVDVVVNYVEENDKIIISDEKSDLSKSIKMVFKRPDFSASQRLIASCTTPDAGGNPSINLMMLQNNLIYFLSKSWDVKTPESKTPEGTSVGGKPVELNAENIGKLRIEIARAIVNRLVEKVGQII